MVPGLLDFGRELQRMENNRPGNYDREKVTEELYRRFSKKGLWRLRMRRFIRGFTWVYVVQLLSGAKRILGLASVAFSVAHPVADFAPVIFYPGHNP